MQEHEPTGWPGRAVEHEPADPQEDISPQGDTVTVEAPTSLDDRAVASMRDDQSDTAGGPPAQPALGTARFHYLVQVGEEVDDEVLRSDTEFEVGEIVPFRGEKAIVNRIENVGPGETDRSAAIYRRLYCELA